MLLNCGDGTADWPTSCCALNVGDGCNGAFDW